MITATQKQKFYTAVRSSIFGGKLKQSQVDGCEAILEEWNQRDLCDLRRLAYILATVFHETAATMQPIEEYGKGKGKPYGQKKANGKAYYGRGFVQLTWDYNYKKMGTLLGVDLYARPELALDLHISTQILFEGMLRGSFTGKKLKDYFYDTKEDYVNARRIVNGLDRADHIAAIAKKFLAALQ